MSKSIMIRWLLKSDNFIFCCLFCCEIEGSLHEEMENDTAHYISIWAAFISPLQQADKKVTFSNGKTNGLFYNEVPIIFQYRVPFLFRRMKCGTTCDKKRISDMLLCVLNAH